LGRKNTRHAPHAKGIVPEGSFTPTGKRRQARWTFMPAKEAQSITMAPIFADESLNPFGFDCYDPGYLKRAR
jgi:hypothetical protein